MICFLSTKYNYSKLYVCHQDLLTLYQLTNPLFKVSLIMLLNEFKITPRYT